METLCGLAVALHCSADALLGANIPSAPAAVSARALLRMALRMAEEEAP